jgi:hypothetical protein
MDVYHQNAVASPWTFITTIYPEGGSVGRSWQEDVQSTFSANFPTDFIPAETVVPGGTRKYGDLGWGDDVFGADSGSVIRSIFDPLICKVVITSEYNWQGGSESVTMGKFSVESLQFDASTTGRTVTIGGSDMASIYMRQRFEKVLYLPATYNWRQSMIYAAQSITLIPGTPSPEIPTPAEAVTLSSDIVVVPGTGVSPWTVLRRLGLNQSYNMYVGRDGGIKTEDASTDPTVEHVWRDDEVVLGANWKPDAGQYVNTVNCYSTAVPGVFGSRELTEGPFGTKALGRLIMDDQTDLVGNNVHALNRATTLLWKYGRMNQQVSVSLMPDPSVDVGDEVSIVVASLGLGTSGGSVWSVDSVEFPFSVTDPMRVVLGRRIQGLQSSRMVSGASAAA